MNVLASIDVIIKNFEQLKHTAPTINAIGQMWVNALSQKHKILFCGNGGSAADAQHLAAELVGRYKINRHALAAISLSTDTSALTAIANDYGFDEIFARQVQGLGQSGDVLVGLSTSGNSKNILRAFQEAKNIGMQTIAFTGEGGGEMKNIADICLLAPSAITNNIQEMHIACGHMLCEYVETHFFK